MGLLDDLNKAPQLPEENELLTARGASLEVPSVEPETPEEAILVARSVREQVEDEEGMRFGKPVDFAEQFNNTVIAAAGAPVDLMTWALNKASNAVAGKDLIDPETAVGGSSSIKKTLNPVGIGSDEEADTYLGYAGNTFGEAAAFLAGGAAIVQKTKQAGGVIGSISKQADKALRTKLDDVVAVEGAAALGMAGGRQYAEENEMGATGSLLLEFTTGALAMVSGAGAKKVILDPLTAKLKNMTATEALEKLSKEEIAEVVARGREEKAKVEPEAEAPKEPTPAPKTDAPEPEAPSYTYRKTEEGDFEILKDGESLDGMEELYRVKASNEEQAKIYVNYNKRVDGDIIKAENANKIDNFNEDIPSEQWLNDKIEEVVDRGTNTAGSPHLGSTTGYFEDLKPIKLPLETTKNVEGYNGEHLRLDRAKVDKLAKELEADGKFEYPPLIGIAYNGKPYIIEGNHRIAASQQAGIPIDIEVNYYDGGQRKAIDGWRPEQIKKAPKETPEAPATPKETPEATPAPKTDVEIDAMSDDELLAELGVEIPKTKPNVQTFYHGTDADFDVFDMTKLGKAQGFGESGFFLHSDPKKAVVYDKRFNRKSKFSLTADEKAVNESLKPLEFEVDTSKALTVADVQRLKSEGKIKADVDFEGHVRPESYFDNNRDAWKEAMEVTGKKVAVVKTEGSQIVLFNDPKVAKRVKRGDTPKETPEPTPAPKKPEAAPEVDPIDASIKATREILEGDRTGGKGARVTRKAKRHFRAVSKEFFDDIGVLLKTKDVEAAKKILSRIDKYIEFDRIISKKDYAQGSELQANTRQAMDNGTTDYAAGISAAANERTENLNVLKGMLQKLVDEDAPLDTKTVQKVAGDVKKKAEGAPKLSKEEKLDAVADQAAKTFVKERGGVFQQAIDAYFTFRLVQMLNSAKTSFIGIPSAIMMSVVRPIINTPYNIRKATQATGITLSRKAMYASADIASTFEYIHTMAKYHKDIARSVVDTIKNRGDSAFLYRDRHAYIKDEIAEAGEPAHAAKRRMKEAQRRVRASEAKTETGRKVLNAKAKVLNSKTIKLPLFFYDYGVSLIGGLEEISLITHALRDARARGIKKAIDAGESNILKYSSDYMESAIDRSGGGFRANYDPEFAEIFNTSRKDHFRAMDLDPNDIRRDLVDGMVAAVNKVSSNPDEMGILARMLMVFIGVPLRAGGMGLSYVTAPYNVAKNVAGGGARRLEQSLGGAATFGKYNKKISELEMEIKGQKKLLKSEDPDVKDTAEKKLAELEDSLAFTKDLKMQKDYEDLGKLAIGTSLFLLGYEMAKNGQVAGTDSWMTEEQKLAAQKVQGAPNSWKVVLGGSEFDFRYFDPLKSVFALGADYARRQAAEEAGALTDDQTFTQFVTSYTKSIATDSPFATGARYVTQLMSPNPETQERGIMGIYRSLIPVPAEIRHFNKFDEEFVTDTTAGEFFDTTLSASIGLETGNYRLTSLGEPKLKEEPSILSYILPYGPKAVPEREPIDDILLEDAMSFRSVSAPQTSISGFKLKNYTNEDNETLYSLYGRLITETRIDGKTQRQALNKLVKSRDFKDAYDNNKYVMDDKGAEINEGIEMIKDIIAEYRAEARRKILETKAAADYVDGDGNNIYDILKEREAFDEQPESLLETLNIQ